MPKAVPQEILQALRGYVIAVEEHREAVRAQARAEQHQIETGHAYQEAWRGVKVLSPARGAYRIGEQVVVIGDGDYPAVTLLQGGD